MIAYFQQLPDVQYWYDFNRLSDNLSSPQAAEEFIKKMHQSEFTKDTNADKIFIAGEAFYQTVMWKGSGIVGISKFKDLLKNDPDFWKSEVFDFVKVE